MRNCLRVDLEEVAMSGLKREVSTESVSESETRDATVTAGFLSFPLCSIPCILSRLS